MNEDCDGGKYPVKVEISEPGESHRINILDGNTNNITIVNTDLIKEIHECQFCDKTYPSKTQLSRHLREKHGVKTYKKHIKLFPSEIKNLMSSSVAIKVEPLLDNVTNEDLEDENTKITSITNTDPFRDTLTINPWQVESIEAFAYLKCPECVFDCKEEVIFQNHAVENHPLSNVLFDVECKFFDKIKVKQESSNISVVKQEVPEILYSVEENKIIEKEFSKNQSNQKFSLGQKPVYDKSDSFFCHICQISFDQKKHYKAHITHLNRDGTRSLKCCACDKKFSFGNGIRNPIRHIKSVHLGNSKTRLKMKRAIEEDKNLQVSRVKIFPSIKNIKASNITIIENPSIDNITEEAHNAIDIEKITNKENGMIKGEISENEDPTNTLAENINYGCENSISESVHEGKKKFGCSFCTHSYHRKSHLKEHVEIVHEGKKRRSLTFKCHFCAVRFIQFKDLKQHIGTEHEGKKPHNCSLCNSGFILKAQLTRHFKVVHEKSNFCAICHTDFALKSTLKTHMKAVHEDIQSIAQKPTKERLKCNQCDKTYSGKMALESHVEVVHLQLKKFQCDQCPLNFASKNGFKNHVASEHEKKEHSCTKCDRIYKTKIGLKDHVLRFHEKRLDFKCEYCGKEFPSLAEVNRHVRLIHNGIKVKCDLCDKEINTLLRLWKHKVFHHNETKDAWICKKCPRKRWSAFQTQAIYDKHMKEVHEGIKPNKCNICSRMFSTMKTLNLHISKIHEASEENQYHMAKKKST